MSYGELRLPDDLFEYHSPNERAVEVHTELRQRAQAMSDLIESCTPSGPLQDAARLAISDALMSCNRAVALAKENLQ